MPKSRSPYPPEFRAEAVELVRSGTKSFSQLSRDLGVFDQTLRNCVRQADIDTGWRHDLLKKAAVFFARDGGRSR